MSKYIYYLYPEGPFEEAKPIELFETDRFDLKTVDIPDGTIGFRFIEAEKESEAEQKLADTPTYFIGNFKDVVTLEQFKQNIDPWSPLFVMHMEELGLKRQFHLGYGNFIGISEDDMVLDPASRKIVYPQNKKLEI